MTAWQAFWVLHAQRSCGFAANPIGVADALAYISACGLDGVDRLETLDLVIGLDLEWRTWSQETRKHGDGS